ncbi:MAG: hypothetical protein AB8H80_23665 [Planctomycetota bacterium]
MSWRRRMRQATALVRVPKAQEINLMLWAEAKGHLPSVTGWLGS